MSQRGFVSFVDFFFKAPKLQFSPLYKKRGLGVMIL